jgi:antitoxin component of MazEF toxin-antitoxin module
MVWVSRMMTSLGGSGPTLDSAPWISRISSRYNAAMKMLKIRRIGNSNMVALPKEWEDDGFAPGAYVLVERDQTGEIRMLRAHDMASQVDALAEDMIEKHAEALRILAEHDRNAK